MKTCKICGEGFVPNQPWHSICGDACRVENRRVKRRKYYADNSQMILRRHRKYIAKYEAQKPKGANCKHCGEWFDYSLCSRGKGDGLCIERTRRYCTKKCRDRAKAIRQAGGFVEMPCIQCGSPMRVTQKHANGVKSNGKTTLLKYCSDKCRKESKRVNVCERLAHRVRNVIRKALMRGKKSARTEELTGCSILFLKRHIELQFSDGMSWDKFLNGGKLCIHIDHIKPISSFDLSNPKDQKRCFHYSNLQPLWAIDNIRKGAKE